MTPQPRQVHTSRGFFVFTHAMRTFDKLIATIPARRGAADLRARFGATHHLMR
jgi:hypothetical protein